MKIIPFFLLIFSFLQADIWLPYTGFLNGSYHLGIGSHLWSDHLEFRNMQLRLNLDILPGIRYNAVIRSNKQFTGLDSFEPNFDEGYLEAYLFDQGKYGKFSGSLKIGEMRYLRFPQPDLISQFDQVPGTEDLRYNDVDSSYTGNLLTLDYKSNLGIGYHFGKIDWDYGQRDDQNIIENYVYYKNQLPFLDLELRYGILQLRHPVGPAGIRSEGPYQLGAGGEGFDIYLGTYYKGYNIGFLYENIYDEKYSYNDIRTGIIVKFSENPVTKALGSIRFDYTRAPQGFGAHFTIAEGHFGYENQIDLNEYHLVGEVEALRVITYWQNGQGRNFYEHKINHWGEVDGNLKVTVSVEPWYLALESLVSPHTDFKNKQDLIEWEKDRQGPAELNQKVIYRYYKKN